MRKWISFFYSLLFLVSTYGDTRFTDSAKPYIDYFTVEILDKNKQRICNGTMIPGRMVLTSARCVKEIIGANNPDFSKLFVKNAVSNFESDVCFNTPPQYNTSCNDYPIISAKISEDTFDWAVLYLGENHNTNMLPGEVASLTPIESDDSTYILTNNNNLHRYAYILDDDEMSKVYSQLKMSGYGNAAQQRTTFYSDMPLNYLSSDSFSFRDTNKSVLITEREGSPVYSKSCYDSKSLQRDIPRLRGIVGAETTVDVVAHQGLQRALNTPPWSGDSRMIYIQPKSNVTAIENATGEYLKPYINSEEAFKNINREEFVTLGFLGDEAFDGSRVFPTMNATLIPLDKAVYFIGEETQLSLNQQDISREDKLAYNAYVNTLNSYVRFSYFFRIDGDDLWYNLFPLHMNRTPALRNRLTGYDTIEINVRTVEQIRGRVIPRMRTVVVYRGETRRLNLARYDLLQHDERFSRHLQNQLNNLFKSIYEHYKKEFFMGEYKLVKLKLKKAFMELMNARTIEEKILRLRRYDLAREALVYGITANFGINRGQINTYGGFYLPYGRITVGIRVNH